jgi:hypothetical protein
LREKSVDVTFDYRRFPSSQVADYQYLVQVVLPFRCFICI